MARAGLLALLVFGVVAAPRLLDRAPADTSNEPAEQESVDGGDVVAPPGRSHDPALRALPGRVYDPVWAGETLPDGFRHALPRDAILPIYDPTFVAPSEVTWPDDLLVIGLEIEGDARAYPVDFLDIREMVIDRVGDVPVVISWCPLCGTAMVHRRELDGREILFGIQGALHLNAMTWWDHDTGSVWSQPLGEAILGPRAGETVELLPSQLTTWAAWRAAHPDTWALEAPQWALDSPGPYEPLDLAATVVVVELVGEVVTFAGDDLRDAGAANTTIAGIPVAVVIDPANDRFVAVLGRELGEMTLTLAVVGDTLVDQQTGSVWDPVRGFAVAGALQGESLAVLPGFTAFAKDVTRFWPEARAWSPG